MGFVSSCMPWATLNDIVQNVLDDGFVNRGQDACVNVSRADMSFENFR